MGPLGDVTVRLPVVALSDVMCPERPGNFPLLVLVGCDEMVSGVRLVKGWINGVHRYPAGRRRRGEGGRLRNEQIERKAHRCTRYGDRRGQVHRCLRGLLRTAIKAVENST